MLLLRRNFLPQKIYPFLIDAALTGLMLDYLNSSVANDGNPSPVVPSCVSAQLFGSVSRTMMSGMELLFQLTE